MVFYGISLASDNLGGNQYRNFVLTSLVEFPAIILVIISSNRYNSVSKKMSGLSYLSIQNIIYTLIKLKNLKGRKVRRNVMGSL